MEFLGFTAEDFDFFRKKEKMTKEEYEKNRNLVKLHFRSLCYELQKIYHRTNESVLEVNKEFSNFNRRSLDLGADYGTKTEVVRKMIDLNCDYLGLRLVFSSMNEDTSSRVLELVRNRKDVIWNYMMLDKHNQILVSFKGKSGKPETLKLTSLDMNEKNYESLLLFIEKHIKAGKLNFELVIQHVCPKNEAVKQNKNLANILFKDMLDTEVVYQALS